MTAQELKLVLERFGSDVTMSEAKEIIAVVDTGQTGKLGTYSYQSRLAQSFETLTVHVLIAPGADSNCACELTRMPRTIRVARHAQLDTIALKWPRRYQLSDAPQLGWPEVTKRTVECRVLWCGVQCVF